MSIFSRDNLQAVKSPMGIILIILILLGIGSYFYLGGGPAISGQTYFYDYEADKVFSADIFNELPPVQSPYSGKETGAYIYIYSCDPCADFNGMTIQELEAAGGIPGYLAVYSDQVRAMHKQTGQIGDYQTGRLVKRVTDARWMPAGARESALASEARSRCGQSKANACQP